MKLSTDNWKTIIVATKALAALGVILNIGGMAYIIAYNPGSPAAFIFGIGVNLGIISILLASVFQRRKLGGVN